MSSSSDYSSSDSDTPGNNNNFEEEIPWRKKELQRRIVNRKRAKKYLKGFKKQESSSNKIHPALENVIKSTSNLQMDILDQDARQRSVNDRSQVQFQLTKDLRQFKSSLSYSTRALRSKHAALSSAERSINRMSQDLFDTSSKKTHTQTLIDKELLMLEEESNKESDCTVCGRTILDELIENHEKNCTGITPDAMRSVNLKVSYVILPKPEIKLQHCDTCFHVVRPSSLDSHVSLCKLKKQKAKDLKLLEDAMEGCWKSSVAPKPPSNVRIDPDSIKCDSFVVLWDPPVFTGSSIVHDYEISLSKCTVREVAGEELYTYQSLPSVWTSRWCCPIPIADGSFRVTGLTASSTYGRIFLRSRTENGISAPSNEIEVVKTIETDPPSVPYGFRIESVADSSITLEWKAPFHLYGSPIEHYEVRYTGFVPKAIVSGKNESIDVRGSEEKSFVVSTGSSDTSFTLKDLRAGQNYSNFYLFAYNNIGMKSAASEVIPSIKTFRKGMGSKHLEELDMAVKLPSKVIDSDFYHPGFLQRYDRLYFIQLISKSIKDAHPELAAQVDALVAEAEKGEATTVEDFKPETTPPKKVVEKAPRKGKTVAPDIETQIKQRRQQFHYRIGILKREISDAIYNIQWDKDRRTDLMGLLHSAEKRLHEKQGEYERARQFRGPEMDSSVIHGKLQRFTTEALVQTLEEELDIDKFYIADTKKDLIQLEKYLISDADLLDAKREELLVRQKALATFEKEAKRSISGQQTLKKFTSTSTFKIFLAWREFVQERFEQRSLMNKVFHRLDTLYIRSGFDKWKLVNSQHTELTVCPEGTIGIGGKSLVLANQHRQSMENDAHNIISMIRKTSKVLEHSAQTSEQRKALESTVYIEEEESKDFYDRPEFQSWRQGDSKMSTGDYKGAYTSYNRQLNRLGEGQFVEQGRLLSAMGKALLMSGDKDHALLKYRRACIIADHATDRIGEAVAYAGIGQVHAKMRSTRSSIEAFERALLAYEELCDSAGQLECIRGLEKCYQTLEDLQSTEYWAGKGNEIEYSMSNKLTTINERLHKLRKALLSVSAKPKTTVIIERVAAIVPRLRTKRLKLKLEMTECKQTKEAFAKLLKEKEDLLLEGEQDLRKAATGNATHVDSKVVTGSMARFEVKDFSEKISKLLGMIEGARERIETETKNAEITVSNLEDEIEEIEEELKSETGQLMRRVIAKQEIRVFKLNDSNRRLGSVFGAETGGVLTCVGSVDDNMLLVDTLTGVSMGQVSGEKKFQTRVFESRRGHRKAISCIFYFSNRIYTGGMDFCVGVYEILPDFTSNLLNFKDQDFDAAVMSICADINYLLVGCADCNIYFYDAVTFEKLYNIGNAHYRTVTCLSLDLSRFVSGGADGEIRMWKINAPTQIKPKDDAPETDDTDNEEAERQNKRYSIENFATLRPDRKGDKFFNGHLAPITCIQYEGGDLVSGDRNGVIIIWDKDELVPIHIIQVHDGPVTCLQFDTTRIVSGGNDTRVNVTDIPSGQVVQNLDGHTGRILDLQFDLAMLLTVSTDGTLRQWTWQSRTDGDESGMSRIYHILGPGETLRSMSLRYRVSSSDILKWNGIRDVASLYIGQRLLIQPPQADVEAKTKADPAFGKLEFENMSFFQGFGTGSKQKSRATQLEEKRVAALAKEYFPPLLEKKKRKKKKKVEDAKDSNNEKGDDGSDGSSSSGYYDSDDSDYDSDSDYSDSGEEDND